MFLELKTVSNEKILFNVDHISVIRALTSESCEVTTLSSSNKFYIKMSYSNLIKKFDKENSQSNQ